MNSIRIFKQEMILNLKNILYFLFSKYYSLSLKKNHLPQMMETDQKVILFFILPGFKQYILNLLTVANALKASGQKVVFVYCDKVIDLCLWQLSVDVDRNFCNECQFRTYGLLKNSDFEVLSLTNYLFPEDRKLVKDKLEACKSLDEFEIDGKKVGDLALIDLTLTRKIESFDNLSAEDLEISKKFITNCALVYLASKHLFEKINIDQIGYNGEYSTNLAIGLAARLAGKRVINITTLSHKIADTRRVFLFDDLWEQALLKNFEYWPQWRDLPNNAIDVQEAYEDLLTRLNPKSGVKVYSPQISRDISMRDRFKVGNRKFIVAFTSSEDEALSTKKSLDVFGVPAPQFEQPFKDQISWIQFLTEYAKKNPDCFIALRVHPRSGVNRFEKIESKHNQRLRAILEDLKIDNFKVVWPEESVSSYSLGFESDLVLISWSNIGMELARAGVPVLASMVRISSVPFDDFIVRVNSIENYVKSIDELLVRPKNAHTLIRAHRWYSVSKFKCSVFLSEKMLNIQDFSNRQLLDILPEATNEIEKFFRSKSSLHDIYMEEFKNTPQKITKEEIRAHLAGLKIIFHFIMTGQEILFSEANLVKRNAFGLRKDDVQYKFGDKDFSSSLPVIKGLVNYIDQFIEMESYY